MDGLKLFYVYHTGSGPCWHLRVAQNPEEALLQCFSTGEHGKDVDLQKTCRVEEVSIPGYEISVRKLD